MIDPERLVHFFALLAIYVFLILMLLFFVRAVLSLTKHGRLDATVSSSKSVVLIKVLFMLTVIIVGSKVAYHMTMRFLFPSYVVPFPWNVIGIIVFGLLILGSGGVVVGLGKMGHGGVSPGRTVKQLLQMTKPSDDVNDKTIDTAKEDHEESVSNPDM